MAGGIPITRVGDGISTDMVKNGNLFIISQNYYDAIADSKVPNHFPIDKFGTNTAVGAAEEIVWTAGNGYTYLSAAETLQVSSSDVDDDGDPAGTGARTVTIEGLDANWALVSDTITMNGTTSVETTVEFLRVFRAYVVTAGSSETNEGLISIKDNADTVVMAQIVAGRGQTQMAIWTVPANNNSFIAQIHASESNNKKAIVRFYTRDNAIANPSWRLRTSEIFVNLSDATRPLVVPLKITEKTDIEVRAVCASTGGEVTAGFLGYYEE
jgi:hypothetical protein